MKRTVSFLTAAALLSGGLLVSATSAATASSSPRTSGGSMCIVSLSPTATETLYAIGAGHEVEAVDTDSDYPTHGLPKIRINPFNPSAETVATVCTVTKSHPSVKPNLVVIAYNADHLRQSLQRLHIDVIVQSAPSTLAGAYHEMEKLGRLSGHAQAALTVVASLKKQVATDIASVPAHANKSVATYYELDPTLYSLTSATFVGSLLASLGVTNIADKVGTSTDGGYPQLNREYVVNADPKLVFLADTVCCHVTRKNFAARPAFGSISAVRFDHVVGLNDDIASRWGPRLGILMGELAHGVTSTLADKRVWKK